MGCSTRQVEASRTARSGQRRSWTEEGRAGRRRKREVGTTAASRCCSPQVRCGKVKRGREKDRAAASQGGVSSRQADSPPVVGRALQNASPRCRSGGLALNVYIYVSEFGIIIHASLLLCLLMPGRGGICQLCMGPSARCRSGSCHLSLSRLHTVWS